MVFTKSEQQAALKEFTVTASVLTGRKIRVVPIVGEDALGYTSQDNVIHLSFLDNVYHGKTKAKAFIILKAVFGHELLHQLITRFQQYTGAIKRHSGFERDLFANILNICEDSAIEFFAPEYLSEEYTRALEYLRASLYDQQPDIGDTEDPFMQFMNALMHFRFFGFLKGDFTDEQARNIFIQCIDPFVKVTEEPVQMERISYATQILELSRPLWEKRAEEHDKMMEALKELAKQFEMAANSGSGSGSDESDSDGSSGGSRSKRMNKTMKKMLSAASSASSSGDSSESDEASTSSSDSKGGKSSSKKSASTSKPSAGKDKSSSDSTADKSEVKEDGSSSSAGNSEMSEGSEDDDSATTGGKGRKSNPDDDLTEPEADEDSGTSAGDSKNGDGKKDSDGGTSDGKDKDKGELSENGDKSDSGDKDGDGDTDSDADNGDSDAKANSTSDSDEKADKSEIEDKGNDDDSLNLPDVIHSGEEYSLEDGESELEAELILSEEELMALNTLHQRYAEEEKQSREEYDTSYDDTHFEPTFKGFKNVCAGISPKNVHVKVEANEANCALYAQLVAPMQSGIHSLASRLKRIFRNRQEEQMYKTSGKANIKRLNCGRITSRVFTKRRAPEACDIAVAIAIDISGSMRGTKVAHARVASIALAEVFAQLNIPTYMFGFTTDWYDKDRPRHFHYVNWKNTKGDRLNLLSIDARDNNFDGYSIRYATEILRRKQADKKLLIVISDGDPAARAYEYISGIQDTKLAIGEANKVATTIGILLGSKDPKLHREMYGYNFIHVDKPEELFSSLGKIIEKFI